MRSALRRPAESPLTGRPRRLTSRLGGGAAIFLLLLTGCASYGRRAAETVATHQVARDFYRARYEESCHVADFPKWCVGGDGRLNEYDKHLREATDALEWVRKAGAKMPLQLGALDADRKGLAKVRP